MRLYPSVTFVRPSGERETLWLGVRESLDISLGEAALEHALNEARAAYGKEIRIEFWTGGPDRHVILSLGVPL